MNASRWFAIGQADGSDQEPGACAAERALTGPDPKLLMVFGSAALGLPAVLGQIRARSGDVPLIGCSTAGEISTRGPSEASLLVAAFGGDGFSVRTAIARQASRDLRAAGEHVAACLAGVEDREHRVLLVLTDGLAGDQQEIIRGAYSVLGAGVPLVGGCAGDDLKMTSTYQMCGDEIVTDAVVGAAVGSDAPLGIGVRHGCYRVGEPLLVTGSRGNKIYTLDDKPALDVYLERIHAPLPERLTQEQVTQITIMHPVGTSRRAGEEQIRFICGADAAERSLLSTAEVPQGALAWIMQGDAETLLDAADAACRDSLAGLGGMPPRGMLAFDCLARRLALGDQGSRSEVGRIATGAAGAPVAGFYTYGEIARTFGVSGFHNQTLAILSIA
jgi:hypothetical protein